MNLQGKKVLVFGSGKSGIGAADLLEQTGATPVIYDGNEKIDKEAVLHKIPHHSRTEVYAGKLPKEVQDSLDLVVLSPGVPTDIPMVRAFYEQGLPVWEKWNWLTVQVRDVYWLLQEPTARLLPQHFLARS